MSKNDFNATINLPKTDFPMRAGLAKREPEMLQHWYDMDLYHEMLKKNDGKPRFSLHDGPPFSNGDIHMGHALNKALKDFIIRSYAMRGYYTPYIPGWDNHGLPLPRVFFLVLLTGIWSYPQNCYRHAIKHYYSIHYHASDE